MTETSSEAFAELRQSGLLGETQRRVLAALREAKRPVTGREIEHYREMPGAWKRLSELERAGLVRRCGTIKCSITKRKATAWTV